MTQPWHANVPVLTDVVASGQPAGPFPSDRDALIAELQTRLAARTFALTNELLRSTFAELEAQVLEQVAARLRRELPEIIDATLREHVPDEAAP